MQLLSGDLRDSRRNFRGNSRHFQTGYILKNGVRSFPHDEPKLKQVRKVYSR